MKTLFATAALLLCGTAAAAQTAPTIERTAKVAPGGLYEVVYNPADKRVYVAATGGRTGTPKVVAIDPATLKTVREYELGDTGVFGLGINARTQTLYGTSTRDGSVAAIDIASGQVTRIKPEGVTGAHVREIAVDEAANRIYVSNVGGRSRGGPEAKAAPSQVWVIDGAAKKVERVIDVDAQALTGLALDAANRRLFATAMGTNEVLVIDLASGKVAKRFSSGGEGSINLALDAGGKRLFVANQRSGDVTVIDAETGAQKGRIATGAGALGISYDPTASRLYVANRGAATTSVIDGRTLQVIASLPTGTLPQTVAVDRATGRAFVTNKMKGPGRNAPADAPVVEDPAGDTLAVIRG